VGPATLLILGMGAAACDLETPFGWSDAPAVELLGSRPEAGHVIPMLATEREAYNNDMVLFFHVRLADVRLQVDLLDPAGRVCSRRGDEWISGGHTEPIAAVGFGLDYEACAYSWPGPTLVTTMVRTRLKTMAYPHRLIEETTFPARFEFSFVGVPLSSVPTAPSLARLEARVYCNYNGPGVPYSLAIDAACELVDDDGDALAVTLAFRRDGECSKSGDCWSESRTWPARPVRTTATMSVAEKPAPAAPATGTLTCTVTDSRGHTRADSVPVRVEGTCS